MSVISARELYLAQLSVRPKTQEYYRHHLRKLTGSRVADIKTRDITKLLDPLPAPSRLQALASFRPFFKWCVARNYIERSPCENLTASKTPPRDRVLSDGELRSIWHAIDRGISSIAGTEDEECVGDSTTPVVNPTYGAIVKLLMLTGQRKSEIASLQKDWLDDQGITLPKQITKNGREHAFPIGSAARAILDAHCEGRAKKALLFPVQGMEGEAAFTGWSKSKRALDKALGDEVARWTLHDLRRTYATTMARLGVRLEVTEKLLNHISGSHAGIVGVYQRYNFWPEMAEAMRVYEEWLSKLDRQDRALALSDFGRKWSDRFRLRCRLSRPSARSSLAAHGAMRLHIEAWSARNATLEAAFELIYSTEKMRVRAAVEDTGFLNRYVGTDYSSADQARA